MNTMDNEMKQRDMFLTNDDVTEMEAEIEFLRCKVVDLEYRLELRDNYIWEIVEAFTDEFGISPEELFHDV